jgi:hypothetical protein
MLASKMVVYEISFSWHVSLVGRLPLARCTSRLAHAIADIIVPKYVARIDIYTVEDTSPESEIGVMYPDVEILQTNRVMPEPSTTYSH